MREVTSIEEADRTVAEAVKPARHSRIVKGLGWLSELADQPQLIGICAGTLATGLLLRHPRLARTGARMLAAELLATKLKSLIKARVDRTRPDVVADGGEYAMRPGGIRRSEFNSFPSGHTAGAVAVARAMVRGYPLHRVAASVTAVSVAAIQVPRCKHYPTDLAAGALVGLVAEQVVHLAEMWARKQHRRRG